MLASLRREPVRVQIAALILVTIVTRLGVHIDATAELLIDGAAFWLAAEVTRLFTRPTTKPSAAVSPASKERLPMNIGNIFDSWFKKPWLDVVHGVEHSPETLALQAKAEADIAAAKDAVAAAVASHEAAAQASVSGVVDNALNSGLAHVPVIGPLVSGEADAVANNFTDNAIHSLIGKLEGFLSPGFNAPPV
jgi:hypothetical protein